MREAGSAPGQPCGIHAHLPALGNLRLGPNRCPTIQGCRSPPPHGLLRNPIPHSWHQHPDLPAPVTRVWTHLCDRTAAALVHKQPPHKFIWLHTYQCHTRHTNPPCHPAPMSTHSPHMGSPGDMQLWPHSSLTHMQLSKHLLGTYPRLATPPMCVEALIHQLTRVSGATQTP